MDDSVLHPLEVSGKTFQSSVLIYLQRYWIYIFLGVFGLNSLFLDFGLFFGSSKTTSSKSSIPVNSINIPFVSQNNTCPQSCIDQFNSLTVSKAVLSGTPVPTLAVTPTLTPIPTATPTTIKYGKEFFVPLRSGSGNSADWESISALGATIDPANYGDIKQATFEVTVRVPTGNQTIWVRLMNAANYMTVVGTEMSMNGGTPTLLISQPITLASGANFYQVQLKTQLQYPAYIDQARIRIQTN